MTLATSKPGVGDLAVKSSMIQSLSFDHSKVIVSSILKPGVGALAMESSKLIYFGPQVQLQPGAGDLAIGYSKLE